VKRLYGRRKSEENKRREGATRGEGGGEGRRGEREGGEPVVKGLEPPFRPLVIDLSSMVCKM